jgi:hypothetical protein
MFMLLAAIMLVIGGCGGPAKTAETVANGAAAAPVTGAMASPPAASSAPATSATSATPAAPTASETPAKGDATAPATPAKVAFPMIDHVVVVVEENHSKKVIQGNAEAPYMNSLMKQGANLTEMYAIEHPSQPNYLDMFAGSNLGVTDDKVPKKQFTDDNLAKFLIAKGLTFGGYSEDLPSVGFMGGTYKEGGKSYARKHSPWVHFDNIPKEVNMPFTDFPKDDYSKLPTVSFVIPNLDNDMHDGTIKQADDWLKENLDPYVQWAMKHNSLLIVTWDEDDRKDNNRIPTFFVGPMVKTMESAKKYDLFGLLRTLEDLYGLGHAGKSATAEPIADIWK